VRVLARLLAVFSSLGSQFSLAAEIERPPVAVAAASDLVFCLPALHAEFAKIEPRVALRVTTGSSGNFVAQIKNGAPFDVFLSADLSYPRALIAAGAADEKSLTLYGVGRLVLWTTRPDLDPAGDLGALIRDPRVRKLALANPAHAPYGRAAREALTALGVWADAEPKLVLGDNIAQTAQFVQTGHADAGIIALALVLGAPPARDSGRWAEIPASLHQPLEQGAVLTPRGAANPAAARYLAFLRTPAARAVFERFGFRLPP
jgi:molybdate transport system substrate-binding protein